MSDDASLPSRRYTCISCGMKGRRSNAPEQRQREPICPRCERGMDQLDLYAKLIPFWRSRRKDVRKVEKTAQDFQQI
jgi:hypothetical protein